MENIGTGLMLMVVGMITVFLILLIVIYGSRRIVNRLSPVGKPVPAGPAVDAATREILEAAVSQLTGGKGHITNITKLQ